MLPRPGTETLQAPRRVNGKARAWPAPALPPAGAAFLLLALLLLFCGPAWGKVLTPELVREPQSLLSYFTWLIDEQGARDIDEISSGNVQKQFTPLAWGMPVKGGGPVWFRMVLVKNPVSSTAGSPPGDRNRLVMNLGKLPPGESTIFFSEYPGPVAAQGVWHSESVASFEEVLLPQPGSLPVSVYIRMDEMPGLWFAPEVSPQNIQRPNMLPPALLLPGLLVAAAIVCLLRAMADKSAWAFWAAAFLGCVLIQCLFPLPGALRPFTLHDLPALLAPGLALMLLPHVGRCMFTKPELSLLEKGVLVLCTLLGAALALAPLLPGLAWLIRLFPLWPLLLGLLFPPCMGFLASRRPGALGFSAVCVLGLLGACLALYGIRDANLHPLVAQAPVWGIALGGLILALSRIPKQPPGSTGQTSAENAGLVLAEAAVDEARHQAAAEGVCLAATPGFGSHSQYAAMPSLEVKPFHPENENPLPDDGPLELGGGRASSGLNMDISQLQPPPASFEGGEYPLFPQALPEQPGQQDRAEQQAGTPGATRLTDAPHSPAEEDEALEAVLGLHGREQSGEQANFQAPESEPRAPSAALSFQEDGSPGSEEWLSAMLPAFAGQIDGGQTLSGAGANAISLREGADISRPAPPPGWEEPAPAPGRKSSLASDESYVFNLHGLVREVHDLVSPLAKNRGLLFSWYTAPNLPALLEGDAPRLRGALTLLLQNAVDSTSEGVVQLSVRGTPGALSPGDLLFSVNDSGSAQRTDAGFFHAWELAARSGGAFNVQYSPGSGTQVSFTARFALPSEELAADHFSRLHAGEEFHGSHFLYADEDDEDALMPVLQIKPSQSAVPEPSAQDMYGPEEPRLAAMSPEQVLADQGFLEPLPEPREEDPEEAAAVVQDQPQAEPPHHAAAPEPEIGAHSAAQGNTAQEPAPWTVIEPVRAPSPEPFVPPAPAAQSVQPAQPVHPVPAEHSYFPIDEEASFYQASAPESRPYSAVLDFATENALEYNPYAAEKAWTVFAEPAPFAPGPSPFAWEEDLPEESPEQLWGSGFTEVCPPDSAAGYAVYQPSGPKTPEAPAPETARTAPEASPAPGNPDEDGQEKRAGAPKQKPVLVIAKPTFRRSAPKLTVTQHSVPPPADGEAAQPAPEAPQDKLSDLPVETPEQEAVMTDTARNAPEPSGPLASPAENGPPHREDAVPDAPAPQPRTPDTGGEAISVSAASPPAEGQEGDAPVSVRASSPLAASLLAAASLPIETEREAGEARPNAAPDAAPDPAPEPEEAVDGQRDENTPEAPEAPRILIAETTTSNRRLMAHYLSRLRHEPLTAANSSELLKTTENTSLSLIIFDADMPEQEIVSTISAIRRQDRRMDRAETPILCLTGHKAQSQRLLEAGSTGALAKPFSRSSFLEAVAAALAAGSGVEDAPAGAVPLPDEARQPDPDPPSPEPAQAAVQETPSPSGPNNPSSPSSPGGADSRAGQRRNPEPGPDAAVRRSPLAQGILGQSQSGTGMEMTGAVSGSPSPRVRVSGPSQEGDPPAAEAGPGLSALPPDRPESSGQTPLERKKPQLRVTAGEIIFSSPDTSGNGPTLAEPHEDIPRAKSVPLPGLEGESLDVAVMPLVPGLLHFLEHAHKDATRGQQQQKLSLVQEASGRLAARAEALGLGRLGKIARCAERAAEAQDVEAVKALLEDLEPVLQRYVKSLGDAYESFIHVKR